ncbi:Protein PLANT CADMIUM RESISTANCE 9, partial [Morella rubra]
CLTFWCPCVTFGRIAEITDRGDTSCFLGGLIYLVISRVRCQCLYTRIFRSKLRGFYSLPEDPCGDCCVHCWCGPCALCQEYRELTARGMEPANGWMANADKMNAAAPTTPPSVAPTMNR